MSERDYGHMMFAGRSHYSFEVGISDHDDLQRGVTAAKITQVTLPRESGDALEYLKAKDTAALFAIAHHGGMPTYVKPVYKEN